MTGQVLPNCGHLVVAAQIGKPMFCKVPMLVPAVMQKGEGIVENKACAADQMPCGIIIDRTIIKKMVEKSTLGIMGARRIEIQNAGNVIPQECRTCEVRIGGQIAIPNQPGRCASIVSRHDVTIRLCAKSGRAPASIDAATSPIINAY
jgi:hypothetical protein